MKAKYNELIKKAQNSLNKFGFKKRGTTFYQKKGKNFGLIEFQKSGKSTKNKTIFTINLGVCSGALSKFYNSEEISSPKWMDCHWQMRIGRLMPEKKDHWWEISSPSGDFSSEIISLLENKAVPAIKKHITDTELLNAWLEGKYYGLTEFQRFKNVLVLLKSLNRNDEFLKIADELQKFSKGKIINEEAVIHINTLTSEYG